MSRRALSSWISGSLLSASVGVFTVGAYLADGEAAVSLDTHDDGAWLLYDPAGSIVHYNGATRRADGSALAIQDDAGDASARLNVLQIGTVAAVLDPSADTLAVIDSARRNVPEDGGRIRVPQDAFAVAAVDGVYVVDAPSGTTWRLARDEAAPLELDLDDSAAFDIGEDAVAATGVDGSVWAYSRTSGALSHLVGTSVVTYDLEPAEGADLTVIGGQPLVLAGDGNSLQFLDGERPTAVTLRGVGPDARLQVPSVPAGDGRVALADGSDVKTIDIRSGTVSTVIPDLGENLVRPVNLPTGVLGYSQAAGALKAARVGAAPEDLRAGLSPGTEALLMVVNGRVWFDVVSQSIDDLFITDDFQLVPIEAVEAGAPTSDADVDPDATPDADTEEAPSGGGTEQSNDALFDPRSDNRSPQAVDDPDFGTRPGRQVDLPVLWNDVDPNNDPLLVAGVQSTIDPAKGSFGVSGDRRFVTFTPADGLEPGDVLEAVYDISDGRDPAGDTASVTVTVRSDGESQPPRPQPDDAQIEVGRTLEIDVLANDWDPDGDAVFVDVDSVAGMQGVQVTTAGRSLEFTAPAEAGTVTIPYRAVDEFGRVSDDEALVTVEVLPAGDIPPVLRPDTVVVREGDTVIVDPTLNDSDANREPILLGEIALDPESDGISVDQPEGNELGITGRKPGHHRILYTADGATAWSAIRVEVVPQGENQPPVATDLAVELASGVPDDIDVRRAVRDGDGDPLTITLLGISPADPELSVVQRDNQTFTLTSANLDSRIATVRYRVDDGRDGVDIGLIRVNMLAPAENRAPVAGDDVYERRFSSVMALDVLANDRDPERQPLRLDPQADGVSVDGGPAPSDIVQVGTRDVLVTPPESMAATGGTITFDYTIHDDAGLPDSGAVTLTVLPVDQPNRPPVGVDDQNSTETGRTISVPVLDNDTDPDGDRLQIDGIASNSQRGGSAEISADRTTVVYTAPGDLTQSVTDRIEYIVSDGTDADIATLSVDVLLPPDNRPPVVRPSTTTLTPGSTETLAPLDNVTDPDGDSISLAPGSVQSSANLEVAQSGNQIEVTVLGGAGERGVVTFGASDGKAAPTIGTITILIDATAEPPEAVPDQATAAAGQPVSVDLLANDIGRGLRVQESIEPSITPSAGSIPSGRFTFAAPDATTSYLYTVIDDAGQTARSVLTVIVAANASPIIVTYRVATPVLPGGTIEVDVLTGVDDPEGDPLTFTVDRTRVVRGTVDRTEGETGDSIVTFTAGSASGEAVIPITVRDDAHGHVGTGQVMITVAGLEPLAPSATDLPVVVEEGASVEIDLVALVDAASGTPRFELAGPVEGTAVTARLEAATLTLAAAAGTAGQTAIVRYGVTDDTGLAATGTITVRVTPTTAVPPQLGADGPFTGLSEESARIDVSTLLANDLPAGELTVISVAPADAAALSADRATVLVQPPSAGFGTTAFTYTVEGPTGLQKTSNPISVGFAGAPSSVTALSATPADGSVTLTWVAGDMRGGTLKHFEVTVDGGAPTITTRASLVVTGLTNGTSYAFAVRAVNNEVGAGPSVQTSAAPRGTPTVPSITAVEPGDQRVTVRWDAADWNGTTAQSYVVTLSPGGLQKTVPASTTSTDMTGLTNGTAYSATVEAVSSEGPTSGFGSPSQSVIPFGPPFTPTLNISGNVNDGYSVTFSNVNGNGLTGVTAALQTVGGSPRDLGSVADGQSFGVELGAVGETCFQGRITTAAGSSAWSSPAVCASKGSPPTFTFAEGETFFYSLRELPIYSLFTIVNDPDGDLVAVDCSSPMSGMLFNPTEGGCDTGVDGSAVTAQPPGRSVSVTATDTAGNSSSRSFVFIGVTPYPTRSQGEPEYRDAVADDGVFEVTIPLTFDSQGFESRECNAYSEGTGAVVGTTCPSSGQVWVDFSIDLATPIYAARVAVSTVYAGHTFEPDLWISGRLYPPSTFS